MRTVPSWQTFSSVPNILLTRVLAKVCLLHRRHYSCRASIGRVVVATQPSIVRYAVWRFSRFTAQSYVVKLGSNKSKTQHLLFSETRTLKVPGQTIGACMRSRVVLRNVSIVFPSHCTRCNYDGPCTRCHFLAVIVATTGWASAMHRDFKDVAQTCIRGSICEGLYGGNVSGKRCHFVDADCADEHVRK